MNYYGKTTRIVRTSLSILLVVWGSFVMWAQQSADNAVVPQLVRFSGNLTDDNGKPPTGIVGVTFSLYRDQQGGAPLWVEIQNVQPDKLGHYSVMLGSASNQGLPADLFTSGEPRWVGVQLQGQAEQARVMLVSVPYAMKAGDAQTVGGLPASAFVRASSEGSSATGNSTALGSTTVVSNSGASAVSGGVLGVARNAPPLALTFVETNGGTAGFLPRFTTSNIIGNSNVFQSGGNVGIGTTSPSNSLEVIGQVQATQASDVGGALALVNPLKSTQGTARTWKIYNMTSSYGNSMQFWAYDTIGCTGGLCAPRLTLMDSGSVGIATTAPTQRLQIDLGDELIRGTDNFRNGGDTATLFLGDTNNSIQSQANFGVSISAFQATNAFNILNGGRVGIGTTNPMHPLQMGDGAFEDGGQWVSVSDRNLKEGFAPVDGSSLLAKLNTIPMQTWNYKAESPAIHHLGPMAQDFYAVFGLGQDNRHIGTLDEGGVALAAVQELYRMVLRRDTEVRNLEQLSRDKDEQIARLTTEVERLQHLEQAVLILSTKMMTIETGKQAEPELLRASK